MAGITLSQAANQQEQMSNLNLSPFSIRIVLKIKYTRFYKMFSSAVIIIWILVDHIKKGLSLEHDPEITEEPGTFLAEL